MYISTQTFKKIGGFPFIVRKNFGVCFFLTFSRVLKSKSEVGLSPKILLPSKLRFVDFDCPLLYLYSDEGLRRTPESSLRGWIPKSTIFPIPVRIGHDLWPKVQILSGYGIWPRHIACSSCMNWGILFGAVRIGIRPLRAFRGPDWSDADRNRAQGPKVVT